MSSSPDTSDTSACTSAWEAYERQWQADAARLRPDLVRGRRYPLWLSVCGTIAAIILWIWIAVAFWLMWCRACW